MKWHNESWVKLYIRRTAEWDDLSVMARGIGNELLKYAKNDGSLCRTKGRDPAMAVALVLKPKPEEIDAVTAGAMELIEDGYLDVANGFVWIKNYEDAQERRSPSAVKQKRYRERKQAEDKESTGNDDGNTALPPLPAPVTNAPLPALPGSETRRDELSTYTRARGDEDDADRKAADAEYSAFVVAWRAAGLPQMVQGADLRLVCDRLAAHVHAKEFPDWCAAFKRMTDGWRANNAPNCGATPALMLEHLDKVEMVLKGELDPFAKPASVRDKQKPEPSRPAYQTPEELLARRKAKAGAA